MTRDSKKILAKSKFLLAKSEMLGAEYISKLNNDRLYKQRVILQFNIPTITVVGIVDFNSAELLKHLSLESYKGLLEYLVLIGKAGSYSPHTVADMLYSLKKFVVANPCEFIDASQVLAESQNRTRRHLWDMKQFLTQWYKSGLPGVSEGAFEALLSLPPRPKTRPSGSAVRSPDPDEGHYEDDDYYNLVDVYWREYEDGVVDLGRTVARLLTAQYGRRPVQLAHLKLVDLQELGEAKGVRGRRIEFPGAKKVGNTEFRVGAIEVHPLGDDLWDICQLLASKTINFWEQYLKRPLTKDESALLPLFNDFNPLLSQARCETAFRHHLDSTTNWLGSEYIHLRALVLIHWCNRHPLAPIKYVATGNDLRESSRRMRYSRIRQLVRSGVSRATIQYWAAHLDRSTINIYFDDPAEQARILNTAVTPLMAPLAQAFSGNLLRSEADATRGNDPSSRIELDGKSAVGSCGEHGYCGASVPIPCYRCSKFQPWIYGPHQEVLERVLKLKSIEEGAFRKGSGRRILLPLNFDRDIYAVRVVIEACEAQKKLIEGS